MHRLMSIIIKKEPSFEDGVITMELAPKANRVFSRLESLASCLHSNRFWYAIHTETTTVGQIVILKPEVKTPQIISSCAQLREVLDSCCFELKLMDKEPPA